MRLFMLTLSSALLAAAVARADVVGPPPTSCPTGAVATTCHVANGYCEPDACTSDASCGAGERCVAARLCIATLSCGGRVPTPVDDVTGTCDPGSCASGSSCATRMVCMPVAGGDGGADGGPDAHSAYGCCSAAGARGAAGGLTLLLGVAALVAVRRRR